MTPYWKDENPTDSFTGRAGAYARHRLDYPPPVLDAVLAGLSLPTRAADVGAGTGLMSRLLADRGVDVVAVEPNADMRASFAVHDRVEVRDGRAEDTGLPANEFPLVTCAQAFHWCEPEPSLAEFHRILAPGGRLAVVFNERLAESGFEREYHSLLRELKPSWRKEQPPHGSAELLQGSAHFELAAPLRFDHDRRFDAESLVGRTMSLSYAPRDEAGATTLEGRLRELLAAHADGDGTVRQGYRAHVHLATAR